MKQKSRLYFFTNSFPYGKGESFIENEILYLSKSFEKIIIIPLSYNNINNNKRATPNNCIVLKPIIRNKLQHYLIGLFGLKIIPLYFKEFFKKRIYLNTRWLKNFLISYCTTNNLLQSKKIRSYLSRLNNNDILYFYWGSGAANIIPLLDKIKAKKIIRLHGGDLYEERNNGYIPIRENLLKHIDLAVFISLQGKLYLKRKYPKIKFNSILSYLGTNNHGISKRSNDEIFRIVSCSFVSPVKRIHLIYNALQLITDYEIEWTHIGGGEGFKDLKSLTINSRNNIKVKLLGDFSNKEVMYYYKTKNIDVFINVSSSEGLPVSLMEAISFNIPVIGTDVGGSSEIVTPTTGVLLNSDPTEIEIIAAINKVRKYRIEPRIFWEQNFDATKNYPNFINQLINS